MIVAPFDVASLTIVLTLNTISLTSYTIALFKIFGIEHSNYFIALIVMLFLSQVFYSIFACFEYKINVLIDAGKDEN